MRNIVKLTAIGLICCQLTGCLAAVVGGVGLAALIAHDRRSTGTIVEDHSIELKVYKIVAQVDTNEDTHISAVSYNNNLLLVGQALTPDLKEAIEQQVRRIPKVQKIYNEILIAPPTSMMTRSSDSITTAKIKSDLLVNKRVDPTRIKIVTEDGVVYLLGLIHPYEEEPAVETARRVSGVRRVVKLFEFTNSTAGAPQKGEVLYPKSSGR
ncbi:MAG: BON domain-containing protein [Pseudomonadota bacterium]